MNDGLDVRLVNTHGESDRADETSDLVVDEVSLYCRPLLVGLACVVARGLDAVLTQDASNLVRSDALRGENENRGERPEGRRSQ